MGDGGDVADPLGRSVQRRILVQSKMRASSVVITCIGQQDTAQVSLATRSRWHSYRSLWSRPPSRDAYHAASAYPASAICPPNGPVSTGRSTSTSRRRAESNQSPTKQSLFPRKREFEARDFGSAKPCRVFCPPRRDKPTARAPAKCGTFASTQEISASEGTRGGGRSHSRTCLQTCIPCQQRNYQDILRYLASVTIFTAPTAIKFRYLEPNSLFIKTGNWFKECEDFGCRNRENQKLHGVLSICR